MASNVRALRLPGILLGVLLSSAPSAWLHAGSPPSTTVRRASTRTGGPRPVKEETAPAPTEASAKSDSEADVVTIDVLEGLRTHQLSATAEGSGDGRMTLNLTNRSPRKLRVVLPPGLIASGASGQFGGMGGMMGGGMGGGMMGGGMGGMGGGMGGMGGMGGGMGGMSRGGMGGGTMPASMGMMMLGRLIMTLVGDRDSWDQSSLMSGMMGMGGGMGGMGMGGGMGGMGGGMGGMGGGFRSVPPTGLPHTTLDPKQTRHLPTPLVGLGRADDKDAAEFPEKGEKLVVGDASQLSLEPRTRSALVRLAEDKAPQTICQLVMWKVSAGMDWPTVERLSERWANDYELALARQFVARLDKDHATGPAPDSGLFRWEVRSKDSAAQPLTDRLRARLESSTLLGLRSAPGVPERPVGPAIAFRAVVDSTKVEVHAASTDGAAQHWVPLGSFQLKVGPAAQGEASEPSTDRQVTELTDALAAGLLDRLVRCKLTKGDRVNGKRTYRIRIDNGSPLILNGLALEGTDDSADPSPTTLAGFCVPPRKSLTVPIAAETVDRLGLTHGLHAYAADLSGL